MANLVSNDEWLEFQAAIGDVTDTFYTEPITLHIKGDSLDVYSEDEKDFQGPTYSVLGRATYGTNTSDASKGTPTGEVDRTRMFIAMATKDLVDSGIPMNDDLPEFNIGEDLLEYRGEFFKVTSIILSGITNPKALICKFEVEKSVYFKPT